MPRSARRLLVLGDIHAEHDRLAGVLRALGPTVNTIVSVGDIVDGSGDAAACIRLLRSAHALVVRGNHDDWFTRRFMRTPSPNTTSQDALDADARAWLAELPSTLTIPTPIGPLLVAHGFGEDDTTGIYPDTDDATIRANRTWRSIRRSGIAMHLAGHTHKPMVRWVEDDEHPDDGAYVVNAGTLCEMDEPCALVLDLASDPTTAMFYSVAADGSVGEARIVTLLTG